MILVSGMGHNCFLGEYRKLLNDLRRSIVVRKSDLVLLSIFIYSVCKNLPNVRTMQVSGDKLFENIQGVSTNAQQLLMKPICSLNGILSAFRPFSGY